LTRYGHRNWRDTKWPLSLILSMFEKYQSTLKTPVELQDWKRVIATRRNHDRITQLYRPVRILKQSVKLQRLITLLRSTSPPSLPAAASLALITRNQVRKVQKKRYQRDVATVKISPPRRLPSMLLPSEDIPMFTPQDWRCTLYPKEANDFNKYHVMEQSGSTVCPR
jgi:hypothetical protein